MRNEVARYLVAIADHGNFTRAAAELHVSQPALSQRIRQLEEMLGTQLLDRTGRTVRPTDAGQAYIEHARRALREFEAGRRAIRDVENLETGTLRLAFTPTFTTYLVGPLVRRFQGLHPGIAISVAVIAQTEMEAALSEDALDLGIAFGDMQSTDVIAQPLYDEQLCLVVDAGHPKLSSTMNSPSRNSRTSTSHCSIPASPRVSRSIVTCAPTTRSRESLSTPTRSGPSWRLCAAA